MKKVKNVYVSILVVLAFVGSVYYAGEVVAFANSVKWHNDGHPLTLIVKGDKVVKTNEIKVGGYYLENNFHHNLVLEANLESKKSCSICGGKKDKSLIIKMIWPWYHIIENKNLAQK